MAASLLRAGRPSSFRGAVKTNLRRGRTHPRRGCASVVTYNLAAKVMAAPVTDEEAQRQAVESYVAARREVAKTAAVENFTHRWGRATARKRVEQVVSDGRVYAASSGPRGAVWLHSSVPVVDRSPVLDAAELRRLLGRFQALEGSCVHASWLARELGLRPAQVLGWLGAQQAKRIPRKHHARIRQLLREAQGRWLVTGCEQLGIRQLELARRSDVRQGSLSDYMRGVRWAPDDDWARLSAELRKLGTEPQVAREAELAADELANRLEGTGLSQRELARRLRVTSPVVVSWLNGDRNARDGGRLRGRKPIPPERWRPIRAILAAAEQRRAAPASAAPDPVTEEVLPAVLEVVAAHPGVLPSQLYVRPALRRYGEARLREAVRRACDDGILSTGPVMVTLPSGARRQYRGGLYPRGASRPGPVDRVRAALGIVIEAVRARPGRSRHDVAHRLPGVEEKTARAAVAAALEKRLVIAAPTPYAVRGRRHVRMGLYVPEAAPAASGRASGRGWTSHRWATTWRQQLGVGRRRLSELLAAELGAGVSTVDGWQDRGVPPARIDETAAALRRLRARGLQEPTAKEAARRRILDVISEAGDRGIARRRIRPHLCVGARPVFDETLDELLAAGEVYERPVEVRPGRRHLHLLAGPVPAEWRAGPPVEADEVRELLTAVGLRSSEAAALLGTSRSDLSSWLSGKLAVPAGWRAELRRLPALAARRHREPPAAEPAPLPGPEFVRLRRARGLTQQQLGARVGFSQPVIGRWERSSDGVPAEHRDAVRAALNADEAPTLGRWARALASAREAAGLRQSDVAGLVGVRHGSVSAWESGRAVPPAERRAAVERALAASWPSSA